MKLKTLIGLLVIGVMLMPGIGHAQSSVQATDHGTIGGGPGSQGSVNLDALFGGNNAGSPIVQGNDGTTKGIDDWDELNPDRPGNVFQGPPPGDANVSRVGGFDGGANLRTGTDPLSQQDFDTTQANFDFETGGGTNPDGFRPGTIGGDTFIQAVGNGGPPQFGVDNPADFVVLAADSPEASQYCGDDL